MNTSPGFKTTGFYLHTHWAFNYPFAVRTWTRQDFKGMFSFLRALDFDRVMIWPITEALPPPLSDEDASYLDDRRTIVADAQSAGLECWVTFAPNISTRPEIRQLPVSQRHFNLHARTYHLDQPVEQRAYFTHLRDILGRLNNADGYVFIDGDPGSYAGARPEEYMDLLRQVRGILNQVGAGRAKVIPWLWSGWGADWIGHAPWTQDFRPLTEAVLRQLKTEPPDGCFLSADGCFLSAEPWELLPGRSFVEGWANGRINLRLVEQAGLVSRSTFMAYEIIEFEPVPPAVTLQFDAIRRVLRQELRHAGQVHGIFGNAQQPIMPLPNLYLFARGAKDPVYLDLSDEQVLADFANLLGGPVELLLPAWRCLEADITSIPVDLPRRLHDAHLTGSIAACLPGGPDRYLHILAEHLEARRVVLDACAQLPNYSIAADETSASERLARAILALERWWQVHGFVGGGEARTCGCGRMSSSASSTFTWAYTHPRLLQPLTNWVQQHITEGRIVQPRLAGLLADSGRFTLDEAEHLIAPLLRGEIHPVLPGSQPHNDFV